MFEGTIPAIITPFLAEPSSRPAVDYASLESLVEWQLGTGISAIVVCGTTGESATLDKEEKLAVISHVVNLVNRRVPVIAGTGSNDTSASVELTQEVKKLGVDAALAVAPYYNKPNQEGLYQHFRQLAKEGGLPLIVYNIPGRSVVEISVSTFKRLAEIDGIVAVKQAVDSITRLTELSQAIGNKVDILAGDDALTYCVMALGGKGVISASASVIPEKMVAITSAARKGDLQLALNAQYDALEEINALFVETNPSPAKAALKMMGKIAHDTVRLPLVPVTAATRELLKTIVVNSRV